VVRARFYCSSKTEYGKGLVNFVFTPVVNKSKENPTGGIVIAIDDPLATKQFKEGKEYYVEFKSVEEVERGSSQ
jgi:hypothetical protein